MRLEKMPKLARIDSRRSTSPPKTLSLSFPLSDGGISGSKCATSRQRKARPWKTASVSWRPISSATLSSLYSGLFPSITGREGTFLGASTCFRLAPLCYWALWPAVSRPRGILWTRWISWARSMSCLGPWNRISSTPGQIWTQPWERSIISTNRNWGIMSEEVEGDFGEHDFMNYLMKLKTNFKILMIFHWNSFYF